MLFIYRYCFCLFFDVGQFAFSFIDLYLEYPSLILSLIRIVDIIQNSLFSAVFEVAVDHQFKGTFCYLYRSDHRLGNLVLNWTFLNAIDFQVFLVFIKFGGVSVLIWPCFKLY